MPRAASSPFVCAECGKSFGRRSDLNRHALTHDTDATRYYCAYPKCDHSSLQKSNLKTHYISKHLNQRPHECHIDGCSRAYGDASALIRHEKVHHGYFRKVHKPYERPMSKNRRGVKLELDDLTFVKGSSRAPSSTPSFCDSSSAASSPTPSTPLWTASFAPNPSAFGLQSISGPQSTDAFLHEMIPELFPDPKLGRRIPSRSAFDTKPIYPFQQSLPRLPFFGLQMPRLEDFAPLDVPFQVWCL